MKCCLLELERETTSEQCSLACASLGGRKKENEGPNANASLVMQDYPLFLIFVHLTLQCVGDICPNLQHLVFLDSKRCQCVTVELVERHVCKLC